MPTPEEIVRLQLERSLSQDAIARNKKRKRLDNSILPTFMGENGKVRQLGQGESNALILPNLHYEKGEEMRPIVVRGGLMSVDNRSYLPIPIDLEPVPVVPVVPVGTSFALIFSLEQFTVTSDEVNVGTGFGGALGIEYSLPVIVPISLDGEGFPIIQNPATTDPDYGIATITYAGADIFIYKFDFSDTTNTFLGFSFSTVSISFTDWEEYPSIAVNFKGYVSLDGGGFNLITELTHEFTQLEPNSPELIPGLFDCNILEGYITMEFL